MTTQLSPLEPRNENLADVVYGAIRDAIVAKRLIPGERLTEARLARDLNVSKTPVREAFLRLLEVGLLESDERGRTRVVRPSAESFAHAFEMREALEVFTAQKAARDAAPGDRREIATAAERSLRAAEAGEIDDFRAWDRRFHDAIAAAAGNPRITKSLDEAMALIGALRDRDLPHAQAAVNCALAHAGIAEAILAHEPDEAAARIAAHIRQMREYTVLRAESDMAPPPVTLAARP